MKNDPNCSFCEGEECQCSCNAPPLILDEFEIYPYSPPDVSHPCHMWFRKKDGEGMVIPKEALKQELESLFRRLM